jgi:two-component system, cell cycle sensor histidine kinase and response regulator CckA
MNINLFHSNNEAKNQNVTMEKKQDTIKNTIEALKDSEKRYRRLFESAKDGILILDADTGKVVDANPFLLQLLGYSYDTLCGQYIWELGEFKDIAASKDAFKTLQNNEYIRYDDLPLKTYDGRSIAVEFVSNVYLVDHTRVIQCNIRDITQRIQMAAHLFEAQKMESVGLLAGGIAHDYNNMLTVILGYAQLALDKVNLDRSLYSDLEKIIMAAQHSANITRELLAFARKQTICPVVLDLNNCMDSMITMLEQLVGKDIDVVWQPGANLLPVEMDPIQISEIVTNLCINAREAIAGIGKITIATRNAFFDETCQSDHGGGSTSGKFILLSVSDDGCGMDNETLHHIFEPFFTRKGVGEGSGLGLSVVYGIVMQNNGFINVESEPGTGTTFRIYLPQHLGSAIETPKDGASSIHQGHGETIMVVDDDPALLRLIGTMLFSLGYQVLSVTTPIDAIRLAGEHNGEINLVITDVSTPEMNGRDLADQITSHNPAVRILFMSDYPADLITSKGMIENKLNFIQKPFELKNLAVKMREILKEK